MAGALVTTKLFVPPTRDALVARPRLVALLEEGSAAALTLVAAPAGFGKTTALAGWLAGTGRSVAWVSLDDADREAALFWQYVVAALDAAAPGVGAAALPLLESGQPVSRSLLTLVLNDVAASPQQVELVLDDYHLADGPDVADGMAFLLQHRPDNLHVVISTRADPNLPLARLRARGELVEVRARDLRFTTSETQSYLADVGGLAVAPDDVSALESRTEGWVAALQLAALSMRGRDDVGQFVAGFTGTDRHVVDYLVDEVLSRQPEDVRAFLLQTSVLDVLGGDLCDSVLERTGSQALLESLDRANLFLVPLDDHRRWYRYHHLFADVLRAHLRAELPDRMAELHARAGRWFDAAGDPVAAVRHALAAGEVERAAEVVERATPALRRDRQEATLRRWAGDFPDDVLARRPVLAIGFVGGLMSSNEFADIDRRLSQIEPLVPTIHAYLASPPDDREPTGIVAVDDGELARVPSALELYRAGLALVSGDIAGTHLHAARAIEAAMPDDDVVPSGAAGLSGLAHWACGELDAAHDRYLECIAGLRRAGHVSDALGCYLTVAEILLAQGHLSDARAMLGEGLAVAAAASAPRGTADLHVGCASVALQRGDLDEARAELASARTWGEEQGLPPYAYRSRATAALLAEAEGDVAAALALVQEAEEVYLGDFSPDVRPLPAVAARLQVRLGDLDAAERWAQESGLAPTDELAYLREFEHVTLAEVLLSRHRATGDERALAEAIALLGRLHGAAVAGGRRTTALDVAVLQAVAATAGGHQAAARDEMERAVQSAAAEGEVRAFSRHGALVVPLLESLAASGDPSAFARTVLQACRRSAATGAVPAPAGREQPGLAEPLSARELEVLRLLASDLDGPDIARHLFVSLNTVRTHTKSIYTKLGVNSRRAAVTRGRELGLLT
jgi:LuxR family transcriptional regulator, maltose regulon positive regulatory protein